MKLEQKKKGHQEKNFKKVPKLEFKKEVSLKSSMAEVLREYGQIIWINFLEIRSQMNIMCDEKIVKHY